MGVICDEKKLEKPNDSSYIQGNKYDLPYKKDIYEDEIEASPKLTTNIPNNYYIIAEFFLDKDVKDKEIRIINSYESFQRRFKKFEFNACKKMKRILKDVR